MPLFNLKGSRESNITHTETYKKVVIDYLSIKGFIPIKDSAIDGCLSDLILINREIQGQIETHVEIKWDDFSINQKKFRKEFAEYFLLYLRTPRLKRFKFVIFAKNIENINLHFKLFDHLDLNEIKDQCKKIEDVLIGEDLEYFKQVDISDKVEFFSDTSLYQGDVTELKMTIAAELGAYPDENDIYLRYSTLEENCNIKNDKDKIFSNIKEIKNIKAFWTADTDFNTEREVLEILEYPPPFYLYENKLLSLYPFEDYNNLTNIINESTIQKINIDEWMEDEDKKHVIIALLNKMCHKFCQLIGLYKKEDEYIYFYPAFENEMQATESWIKIEPKGKKMTERKSNRLIFKKFKEMTLNPYYIHFAVNFEVINFDKKLFFIIIPKKVFTSNGVEQLEGKKAKKIQETSFINPLFTRNRNLLLEQLFWAFTLFLSPKLREKHIIYKNEKDKQIQFHISKIIKMIGKDYFELFDLNKKPVIDDDEIDEEDDYNDSILQYLNQI